MIRRFLILPLVCMAATFTPVLGAVPECDAYLFAYFEGRGDGSLQEHLRFAVSDDGITWKALNRNSPVISSDTISLTGGIRDPHILRGEDGSFYMVATDMNTVRDGWGSNPGIVLLKSHNLTEWTHSTINLSKDYPKHFSDAYWVWAPQTIYDPDTRKYMIYFTLRRSDAGKGLVTYYAYANRDFTGFESEPKVLFRAKDGCIDNDIVKGPDGKWHMFFKGNTKDKNGKEIKNGIKKATARRLRGPWKESFDYIDAYAGKTAVEGSGIFKLNHSDEYILMYDLYSSGRYEYQTTKDLVNFTPEPQSFTKDFFPRHGTVMPITAEEKAVLTAKWGDNAPYSFVNTGNPLIRHKHTADPATMVVGDTLWLYTGTDEPGNKPGYHMPNWCVFSTTDMQHWTEHPMPLAVRDFAWDRSKAAYAAQCIERNGKYYYYISTNGSGIGIAVSDSPKGPFKDALGKPLITKDDCKGARHSWVSIDPTVFIDDDGRAYLFWGNQLCYYARLKDNMLELDGEIKRVHLPDFTEAPWVHKRGGKYYLTYAAQWPEKIAYAMSDNIDGPWEYKGIISEVAGNSNTTHPAIVEFKGKNYFFSHIGGLGGGSGSRSVIVEPLCYNEDGTIRKVNPSTSGTSTLHSALDNKHNPILPGFHADPEILYSNKTGRYYIYSTTDGTPGWGGHYFRVYSSSNLSDWTDEGIMLDLKGPQVPWATGNAWAPAIIERKEGDSYKYYFYFSGHNPASNRKAIGVAVADDPAGPFYAADRPIVDKSPVGHGQQIDVDVFQDPATGKCYLYWGNGYMAGAELGDDMTSIKEETVTVMTPEGGSLSTHAFREAPYVFFRNGIYYFMWSVDDTGSPNYHVAYGTSGSPLGKIEVAEPCNILVQRPGERIYGTAHNSVINIPGTDEWRIVYHRINPDYIDKSRQPGIHREVCIDKMEFAKDGSIKPVKPTK